MKKKEKRKVENVIREKQREGKVRRYNCGREMRARREKRAGNG